MSSNDMINAFFEAIYDMPNSGFFDKEVVQMYDDFLTVYDDGQDGLEDAFSGCVYEHEKLAFRIGFECAVKMLMSK